ncbi:pentatricopeptide repeat-containing protein At5g50280, chloroplastic [Trifolium pratense]|uniref:pentatricopeptide repeat-containing protein At5g50280, chloroplastic n=1 Tax=Trifolium pratense TaxID=57577 RepID=UPI001E694B72|nr:pentatricopeptide repeat-containing protein At5g50280, chloroplastic [Trifolium pratense]
MILSLNSSSYCFFFYLQPSILHNTHTKLSFPIHSHNKTPSSLNATPTPLFLPLLEQQEREEKQQQQQQQQHKLEQKQEEEEEQQQQQEQEEEEEEQTYYDDPIYKFFKTRTMVSSQNPKKEGKLLLHKNRRPAWKLASQEDEMGMEEMPPLLVEDNEEMGSQKKKPSSPEGVVGEIVHIARNLPQSLTIEEALGEYVKKVNEKECLEVMEILGKENLVGRCLYFFQWMRSHERSLVTPKAFTLLFPLLGRASMGDKLLVLLPSIKEFRSVSVYNAAISGLLSDGRYEDAWKVYESMETDNILPDHVTCSIVIIVMRKLGHSAKDAWQFFEKMNRKGVRWSEEVLGALIKSFCIEGLLSEALIIQSEIRKKGISSNAIVYNTLMDAFCKSNRVEEAEGLFVEMKAIRIKPNAATFNILMHAYSRRRQPKIVENLLEEMHDFGLKPNANSYTCLISAYGRRKTMSDMAANAFLKMKRVGIKPTSHSYTALIHAYSVSGWHEKAYVTFENMLKEGIKPPIETYTTLLDASRRTGDTETLMKIWKLMRNQKVKGTKVTFNILVDGFAKQGLFMEARDVISEFGKFGLKPTVVTYNMLMNAYARGGVDSKLPQLLKEMEALKLRPDSVTYSTIIYAFVRVRDYKRAFFYHKEMVKSGQVMDISSYRKLRDILDVKAADKNRSDKVALLGIVNKKMGIVKYKGKKDEFWKYKTGRAIRT